MDPYTEWLVLENIRSIGITQIVITHRLQNIINASFICVLDQGQVVEKGTHQELLQHLIFPGVLLFQRRFLSSVSGPVLGQKAKTIQ